MWSSAAFSRERVARRFISRAFSLVVSLSNHEHAGSSFDRFRTSGILLVAVCVAAAGVLATSAQPRFFPDDPIWIDDDKALDASKAAAVEDSNGFDFVVNTFVQPGEKRNIRALDVNTVDKVPDTSWFTNRIGRRAMSLDEIVRGPDSLPSVSLDGWVVAA